MAIYLITVIGGLNHLAFVGSRVTMSLYALHLGAGQATVGMLVALYALCPALVSIHIGKFADKTRPLVLMTVGTVCMVIGFLLPPAFPGLTVLFFSAFFLGFWNQVVNIPLESTAGGMGGIEHRARNYSVLGLGWSASTFLGPVIAGLAIDHLGYIESFVILALCNVPALAILYVMRNMLPARIQHGGEPKHGSALDLLKIPQLRTTIIAGGVVVSTWDLFQFYMPVYGHSIGLSATAIGIILGMVSTAAFIIRVFVPYLVKHMTETQILTYSILLGALSFILLPNFQNPYALGAIGFLLGLGFGCGQPLLQSLAYLLTPKGRIAESTGMRKTVNQGTHMLVPLVFGSLGGIFGFFSVFAANAALLVACAVLISKAKIVDREPRKPRP